jgi:hypothetical protein
MKLRLSLVALFCAALFCFSLGGGINLPHFKEARVHAQTCIGCGVTGGDKQASAGGCGAASTTAYTNFIARSGSLGADDCNYKTLFANLVTHGFFNSDGTTSKICYLYIWAAPSQSVALLDLSPNANNGTTHGTVSFSAHNGYTGDASTFYIDTGVATGNCQNVTTTSISLAYYGLTSRTTATATKVQTGGTNGTNYSYIQNFFTGPVSSGDISSASFGSFSSGGLNIDGMWIYTKVADPNINIYHNGSGTDLGPLNSPAVIQNTTRTQYFFGQNTSGVLTTPTDDQMSFGYMGAGMSSATYLNFQGDINTFMSAYLINKY